jgi:hypothetical protein
MFNVSMTAHNSEEWVPNSSISEAILVNFAWSPWKQPHANHLTLDIG